MGNKNVRPKGVCGVCGKLVALTLNGFIHKHADGKAGAECAGSSSQPVR